MAIFTSRTALAATLALFAAACGNSASSTTTTTGSGAGSSTSSTSTGGGGASGDGDGDYTISPPWTAAPETMVNDNVPHGTVGMFTMMSTDSMVYPTDFATGMPFTRDVAVYVPNQYVPGTEAPFIVVQDGIDFYESTMVPVLDNLIAAKKLPVMIAIFVEPGPNEDTPLGERSFEYDSVSDTYWTFVETELLPTVETSYAVKLTKDPEGRAAMGGSSGGAAAFTLGWFHPESYHRILTYSGSFCDLQPSPAHPHGAWEYHESLIASTPAKPLRVALEVGGMDLDWNTDMDMMRKWDVANKAMASELKKKGYHYRFVFAEGADHIDAGVLAQTLPETLLWVWKGYPVGG